LINYNDANKRITSVEWTLPAGVVARCRIWNTNVDPVNPIYDRTFAGPQMGSENIPGNHQVIEDPEAPGFYLLPTYLLYTINMETFG
jgi:hypothetical protein